MATTDDEYDISDAVFYGALVGAGLALLDHFTRLPPILVVQQNLTVVQNVSPIVIFPQSPWPAPPSERGRSARAQRRRILRQAA